MINIIKYFVSTIMLFLCFAANGEILATLAATVYSDGKYDFEARLQMDENDSGNYGVNDQAHLSMIVRQDTNVLFNDSKKAKLYVNNWQKVDLGAVRSVINVTTNIEHCVDGNWTIDHANSDIDTSLQIPQTICQTYQTPGGGGKGGGNTPCLVPDDCLDQYHDPLIIDLGQDGIGLGEAGVGVYFDMNNDGNKTPMQWVKASGNEAFLVKDHNNNGVIDNGSELFGDNTPLSLNLKQQHHYDFLWYKGAQTSSAIDALAKHGFEALAQYDHPINGGNNDGYISELDDVWQTLALWLDENADGISTPNELMTLSDAGIERLDLNAKQNNRQDKAGNWIPLWSWAYGEQNNEKYKIVDVFFKSLDEHKQ